MNPYTARQISSSYVAGRLAETELRRQRKLARQARRDARIEARRAAAVAATPNAPIMSLRLAAR
jgi:hypothetical protein